MTCEQVEGTLAMLEGIRKAELQMQFGNRFNYDVMKGHAMPETRPIKTEKLHAFLAALQAKQDKHYAEKFKHVRSPLYSAEIGPKYIRIVATGEGTRHVFCFLERDTGNILKCASWKAPAKGARGTVHTPTHGVEYLTPYGAAYLR